VRPCSPSTPAPHVVVGSDLAPSRSAGCQTAANVIPADRISTPAYLRAKVAEDAPQGWVRLDPHQHGIPSPARRRPTASPHTGSATCEPRHDATHTAGIRPSPRPSPRSMRSTCGWPPHAAGSRPPSRPRPKRVRPSPRSMRPAGSTSTSRPTPPRASGRPSGAVPAPTPPTRRSSPPGCGSGSPSTTPPSPTTPPPTGCGR
jgi:hypothetical protein